jgi:hypothetical protein
MGIELAPACGVTAMRWRRVPSVRILRRALPRNARLSMTAYSKKCGTNRDWLLITRDPSSRIPIPQQESWASGRRGRSSQMEEFKFAYDSLLEGRGFELPVPRNTKDAFRGFPG